MGTNVFSRPQTQPDLLRMSAQVNPTSAKLVHTCAGLVDGVEGLAEVVGEGVGGGDDVLAGLDLNGAAAAGGLNEFPDRPACLRFDPAANGEGGEDDGEVCLDGVALAMVDRPGLQVVLGHAEALLDLEEPVVGADDEIRGDGVPSGTRHCPPTRRRVQERANSSDKNSRRAGLTGNGPTCVSRDNP